jgi:signal transduction histidine kinase
MTRARPSLPLTMKVPLLIVALMAAVAAGISKVVLDRLGAAQQAHFGQLTGAYLNGLSTALLPHVIRRDPWEAFDVLDRSRAVYTGVAAMTVMVVLPDGTVLAASDPASFPIQSPAPPTAAPPPRRTGPDLDGPAGSVWIHRELREGGAFMGRIAAEIDVTGIQAVRRDTLATLIVFNVALTVALALLGWVLVRRMLAPALRLSEQLAASSEGRLRPIPAEELPPAGTDYGRLFRRYNAAAAAIDEREALERRLADEERAALVGKLASAMAHEVNNPLGGLFNAIRMIQRHGDDPVQRVRAADIIERGLTGIHNVVRASLVVWRGGTDTTSLGPADIDDMRYLIASEAQRRRLALNWRSDVDESVPVSAQAVRQVALNLLLNACAASSPGTTIGFTACLSEGRVDIVVEDGGPGLPPDIRRMLTDVGPSMASAGSTGLGLWIVRRIVDERGGSIAVEDLSPGTRITARLPHAEPALSDVA